MKPICRNIQNGMFYAFEGGNTFRNLVTDNAGEVSDEKAKEIFRFNPALSEIINEYPIVEDLIKTLKLKADVVGV